MMDLEVLKHFQRQDFFFLSFDEWQKDSNIHFFPLPFNQNGFNFAET